MSKKHISMALHTISVLAGSFLTAQAVYDFDDSTGWLQLFKAIFWMIIGVITFWRGIEGLTTGKLWWKF